MTNRRTRGGASEEPDLWEEYGMYPDRPVFSDRRKVVRRDRPVGQQCSPPERSGMMTSISSICRQCSLLQRYTPILIAAVNRRRHDLNALPRRLKDQGYPWLKYQRAAPLSSSIDAGCAMTSKDSPKPLKGGIFSLRTSLMHRRASAFRAQAVYHRRSGTHGIGCGEGKRTPIPEYESDVVVHRQELITHSEHVLGSLSLRSPAMSGIMAQDGRSPSEGTDLGFRKGTAPNKALSCLVFLVTGDDTVTGQTKGSINRLLQQGQKIVLTGGSN